ncbi:hypothetical protein FALBO_8312 [Fusarium albosuccineum]|uniref:Uncharacterized protein n=1 Tax=Fusarium albosuccineum TaxID=1237068 RepID=A0A8H4LBT5_9HYPO|nr:hypothetical protein FALBO_8312 [Fusarium albosuccineum]
MADNHAQGASDSHPSSEPNLSADDAEHPGTGATSVEDQQAPQGEKAPSSKAKTLLTARPPDPAGDGPLSFQNMDASVRSQAPVEAMESLKACRDHSAPKGNGFDHQNKPWDDVNDSGSLDKCLVAERLIGFSELELVDISSKTAIAKSRIAALETKIASDKSRMRDLVSQISFANTMMAAWKSELASTESRVAALEPQIAKIKYSIVLAEASASGPEPTIPRHMK